VYRPIRNLCLILLVCRQPFTAQKSAEQSSPVFKSETRQVLVDVVVNDRGGHFIPGLKPGNFTEFLRDLPLGQRVALFALGTRLRTLLEDGKAQKIAAFGVHARALTAAKGL
jgi:hypothetical protein